MRVARLSCFNSVLFHSCYRGYNLHVYHDYRSITYYQLSLCLHLKNLTWTIIYEFVSERGLAWQIQWIWVHALVSMHTRNSVRKVNFTIFTLLSLGQVRVMGAQRDKWEFVFFLVLHFSFSFFFFFYLFFLLFIFRAEWKQKKSPTLLSSAHREKKNHLMSFIKKK